MSNYFKVAQNNTA